MSQRTFPRPSSLETTHLTDAPVLDELELVAWHDSDAATWSKRVLKSEQQRTLKPMLGENHRLPEGLLAAGTDSLVIGLTRDGLMWENGKWVENDEMWGATVNLSEDDVAFVARAFQEGCESVLFRPYFPLAWITQPPFTGAAGAVVSKLPNGSKLIAIVDDLDKSAVLELIALAPGPVLYRRHDGKWIEDEQWLVPLRSIDPPSVVVLSEKELQNDVIDQVDESTKGVEFEPKIIRQKKVRAAAFQELDSRLGELEERSILAVAKSIEGIKGAEKLRQYWTVGEGGLMKIRWGTPGSWTRCHRHLTKYLGPRAAGYCTNLCQRMGGYKVACHLGVKGDAAPILGVADYSKPGMFKIKPRKKTGSGKTPYARKERKTSRELTDAEIEQRREAARKSAMARRKTTTDARSDTFKKAPLAEKVKIAAQLEAEAQARVKELESQLRATEDDRVKAQVQGELDDLRDMLSAKDEWLRNARYNELKLADKNIDAGAKEVDKVRSTFNRTLDALRDEQDSLDLQIEAARDSDTGGREQSASLRQEASEMRARAAELRTRAKYATSEIQRIEYENAARELTDGAAERDTASKQTGSSRVAQLHAQRRELRSKIKDLSSQKTHKLTEMQSGLKALREKRAALADQYSGATEYLRSRRARQRPGQFFV